MKRKDYTALAAVFACASIAEGQVVYTDLDPDEVFIDDGTYIVNIDLDGDMLPDLQFRTAYSTYGSGIWVDAEPGWNLIGSVKCWSSNYCCEPFVYKGSAGQLVKNGPPFRAGAYLTQGQWWCGSYGLWSVGEFAYIGFRKRMGSDDYFGWLRIERKPNILGYPGPFQEYRLLDFALNHTPNEPIAAGDPGDTCLVPEHPRHAVTGSTVTLSWDPVPRSSAYELDGRNLDGGTRFKVMRPTSLSIPGTAPGTYGWKVRAVCPSGTSSFSEEDTVVVPALREASALQTALKLFPNPAEHTARLELPAADGTILVELFDMSGRRLWFVRVESARFVELPLNDLTNGSYLVRTLGEDWSRSAYLVVE